ncbi:hypothetical protein HID58_087866, partial [Brassica napus]
QWSATENCMMGGMAALQIQLADHSKQVEELQRNHKAQQLLGSCKGQEYHHVLGSQTPKGFNHNTTSFLSRNLCTTAITRPLSPLRLRLWRLHVAFPLRLLSLQLLHTLLNSLLRELSLKIPIFDDLDHRFQRTNFFIRAGKVIHFTRRGGLEIGTGTYLDKIIQISVPRHGGDNPCPNCGDQSTLDGVISSCLDCFLAGGNLYLFQYDVSKAILVAKQRSGTCTTAPSDPPEEVVHRARYLLSGNGFGEYHLLDNNCEDFAIYCKTGLLVFSVTKSGSSSQVNSVCAAGGVASLALSHGCGGIQ